MSANSILDETFEQLVETGKQTGQTLAKTPSDFAKAAATQIKPAAGGGPFDANEQKSLGAESDRQAQEEIKELYGVNESNPILSPEALQQKKAQTASSDEQKVAQLRQQLHKNTYYQPLITPKQEERPAEKIEREEKQERWALQKEEAKKSQPISVQMAANRTEQFRGTSG